MLRKSLAWLLTLLMVISMFPVSVFATETGEESQIVVTDDSTTGSEVDATEEESSEGESSEPVSEEESVVAKIDDVNYANLQAAIDAAVDEDTIILVADVTEDVTITQKADLDLTIDGGDKTFTGVMTVFGNGRQSGAETLTIKNVVFQAVEGKDSCIVSPDRTVNAYSYSHNVTVDSCKFKGIEGNSYTAAAIRHQDGGDKNWTVKNCTVDKNMHSLLQVNNVEGKLTIDNCNVYSKNGINLNSCTNVEITNSVIDVKGYAVRAGVNSGGNLGVAKTYVFENNTLKTDNSERDAVIVLRASAVDMGLTMTKNVVSGTTHISGTTDATTVSAEANYWDGITAPVVDGTAVEVDTYYTDESLTTLAKVAKGNNFTGYTSESSIWGEVWGNANESFVIKVLDANGNVMGTTSLNNIDDIIDGDVTVTWNIKLDAASNTDGYWNMEWITAPSINNMPAKVELWVDGVRVSGGNVVLNAPDDLNMIYAANVDEDGVILGYTTTVKAAVDVAIENGSTVALLRNSTESVFVPSNVKINYNGYSFTKVEPVAKIGDTEYATLQAAIYAVQSGETIVLVDDISETLSIHSGANLVLDLGGYTLTGSILAPNATLTVKNGSIVNTDTAVSAIEINAGTLTLEDVNIDSARHAVRIDGAVKATINGGTYRSGIGTGTGTYHAVNVSGAAEVDIKDGTFIGPNGTTADSGAAIKVQSGATVEINGGNFSGGKANTLEASGTLTVYFGTFDQVVPQDYIGYGLTCVDNGNGTYTVRSAVEAKIGNKGYASLAEAVADADIGDTIILVSNTVVSTPIEITKNITIADYGTYTIHFTSNAGFVVGEGASLTLDEILFVGGMDDATVSTFSTTPAYFVVLDGANASVTINNVATDSLIYVSADADGATVVADGKAVVLEEGAEGITITGTSDITGAVAKIGDVYYTTLAGAIAAVGAGNVVIELLADATFDYNARDAYGTAETTSLTINGNGKTLTLNQKDSDWASIGLANADAKLVLNNMTIEKTGYGDTSGAWNTHAIIFSCAVEMNAVTINNAIAVEGGATLNNVTINEANGYYGLWIDGNGQTVTVNGGAINATNGGRGIKIADEYVDSVKQVTLNVTGTTFNTAKKAAVLVSSTAGAAITASNVDIANVAEDSVNFVWVDEDWAANYGKVTVMGGTKVQENVEELAIVVSDEDGNVIAYYNDLGKLFTDYKDSKDTINVLLTNDVTTNDVVYGTSNTQVDFKFTTDVDSGVTITLGYTEGWNYVPHMTIGENVTLNVPYRMCVYGKVLNISGTVNTGYLYNLSGAVTVKEGGVLDVTTGDKTVQVKNNGWFEVYGTAKAGTVNVWNDNTRASQLIVSGVNASLTADHIHAWDGGNATEANTITVENGATLTATNLQADRDSEVAVDNATLNAATLTLGYEGNIGTLKATNGATVIVTEGLNASEGSTFTADETSTITAFEAKIGTKYYFTIADAIAAANDGDTVTLLTEVTLTETLTFEKAITLDLGGKTLTGADGEIVINVKAVTTIENGTIKGNKSGTSSGLIDIYANLTMNDVTVETSKIIALRFKAGDCTATLTDCIVTGQFKGYGGSVWVIKSGTYKASSTAISDQLNGTAAVSGGTFYYAIDEADCAPGYTVVNNGDGTYGVKYAPVAFVDANNNGNLDDGEVVYGSLEAIFDTIETGDVYIVITADTVIETQVDTDADAKYYLNTNVAEGVTVEFAFADDWNYVQKMYIGKGVTVKAPYFLVWTDLDLYGTLITDYLYITTADVLVAEGAVVNVNTGDATVQVKSGATLTVNGTVNTATLNVWVGDSKLIVGGANAKVNASWIDIWDGTPSVKVENGATLDVDSIKASRGGSIAVNDATLKADSIELGHNGDSAGTMTVTGNSTVSEIKLTVLDSTVTGPESMTVTSGVDGYTVVYKEGVYSLAKIVATIGDAEYASLNDAFAAAQSGDEVKILVAGTYALSTSGKDITITGVVDGVVFDNIGAKNMGSANVMFNNVTFDYYPNVNYTGLQHSGNLVYNNCTFNGQVFLYGKSETFNNCTFNQNSADAYNVWTYGAANVTFTKCTFNSAGKSVLIYKEHDEPFVANVTVNDCDFIASAPVDGKAAIEMDSSIMGGINLTIDAETTATGFGTGNVSGNSLWNNKKGNEGKNNDITVTVNDEVVLQPIQTAEVNGVYYTSIKAAMDAAKAGDTVTIFACSYTGNLDVNKAITVVGETDDKGNNLVNITGKLNITADGAAVKNLNVNNGSADAGYISAKDVLVEGCTVVGGNGFRYCYTSGTVTFKDSTITGSTYGIHFDGSAGGNIVIDKCVITGWTSFASTINKVTITDTTFAEGNYNQLRFYQNVEMTNVVFNPDMTIDFGKSGVSADFTNCSVTDGSPLTDVIYLPDIAQMGINVTVDDKPVIVEAMIGNIAYLKIDDALAAAQDGDEINLYADVTIESGKTVEIKNIIFTAKNGAKITVNGEIKFTNCNLTDVTIEGSGTTYFYNTINFYGTNSVTSGIDGSDFKLIVNKGATLLISRFVLGYNRNITVYGEIEDAHNFDPAGKTPSLEFNSTSGVSVGGTGTGNLTVENAYIELGNSSWKNAYGTYTWTFKNSYISATSFTNNNAQGSSSATWNVTFDDSVLAAKNYIKNGVGTTYNFTNGSVATTGSLRIDGVLYIDETSSVTTTSQQNNVVGAVDEHGGINGTVTVEGTLTIGSNAKTQLEVLGGTLTVNGGTINLGNNTLTLDASSTLTSSGDIYGAITAADGANVVISAGTYTQDVTEWCVEDFEAVDNKDGTFTVNHKVVAKVGNTEYRDIDEAIEAWTNGTTLTLLADVTLTDVITLSSQEHHYLSLGTYTMTAASGKNAIEIKSYGRSNRSESGALTITADATNPGGINAGSKACIYYKYDSTLANNQYDRPIIYIKGGVFTGSTYSGISSSGHSSAQDKCATINISGGTFNCGLNLTKTKLIISGGIFNYSVGCTGGSTSHRLISGGTFKSFGWMTADASSKFGIGTSIGNYNVGTYIDDNGYLVVGGPVITEAGTTFEASSTNYGGWSSYLQYSSAKENGLYYTSVEEAFADNNKSTGAVTVYVDELDMTDSTYKGTILLPAGKTLTVTYADGTTPTWTVEGADGAKLNVTETVENGIVTRVYESLNAVAQIGDTYYTTLAEALTAAQNNGTITLLWADGDAPIAMNGAVYGKSVTITGTATVDWSKGFLFIGRGGEGNGTVIFDNAILTSDSNSSSYGIHVSGREKDTTNKYDGTLIINNSTIELDYLINKGTMTLDNTTLTVKNGFSLGGRPASETESGKDATATLTLNNGSKLVVNNHNGMGLGYEAIGVLNVNGGSTFETTQAFLVTAKGTMNVNNGTVKIIGTLTNNGTIYVTGESNIAANVTGAGWVYMNGVTLDADTKLIGAKVRFASGTNNIDGSTIDDGFFQVGVGAYKGVDANVDTVNGVVVNVKNAVIGSNGDTYAGWIGTGFYDTDAEKAAAMTDAKYVLNIENSIAAFGYIHVSNDGELNVTGNAATKVWYNNSDYSFYAGDFIINGVAKFDNTDVLALYTKVSCDNGTDKPGTINIVNGTEYEAERHNGAIAGTNFDVRKTGVVNVEKDAELYIGEYTTIAADAVMNVGGTVTALGTITNNGTINLTAVGATLTTPEAPTVKSTLEDYKVIYADGAYKLEIAAAKIGTTLYDTLTDALDAAQSGETVTLLKDAEVQMVLVREGITLDLNGKTVDTSYFIGVNGSDVVDESKDNTGIIKVRQDMAYIASNNSQIPLWTGEGYKLYEIDIAARLATNSDGTIGLFEFFLLKLNAADYKAFYNELKDTGAEDHNLEIKIRVSWTIKDADGYDVEVTQDYKYSEEWIMIAANGSSKWPIFNGTLKGLEKRQNVKFSAVIQSGTGAELVISDYDTIIDDTKFINKS